MDNKSGFASNGGGGVWRGEPGQNLEMRQGENLNIGVAERAGGEQIGGHGNERISGFNFGQNNELHKQMVKTNEENEAGGERVGIESMPQMSTGQGVGMVGSMIGLEHGVVKNTETEVEVADLFENRGNMGRAGLANLKEKVIKKNQDLNNPRAMFDDIMALKKKVLEKRRKN